MKMKRYRENVRETALQPPEKQREARGLNMAFNKGGTPVFEKSSESPKNVFT